MSSPAELGAVLAASGRFETPAYVYELDRVRDAHARLRLALPEPSALYYSVKANPHPAVLATLAGLGCGAEISSPGEARAALHAGFDTGHTLYTGPAKRASDLREALDAGIRWFSADSPGSLAQLGGAASARGITAKALLRVNGGLPGAGHGLAMSGLASQFGADAEWIMAEPGLFADQPGVRVVGLHLYLGTNVSDEAALAAQLESALATAAMISTALPTAAEVVDLGGGFGAPFARSGDLPEFTVLRSHLEPRLDRAFPRWRQGEPRVIFESGRYLTATCGSLLTRVLDVKRSHGRTVIILESGINHLGGAAGLRRLPPIAPELVTACPPGTETTAGTDGALVTGPLCTPLDVWSRDASLGPAVPGDLLAVPNVGAYGLSASLLAFLGHLPPVEVVIDGGRVTEATRLHAVRLAVEPLQHPATNQEP
jgi:diaminopimelate decarboxylase